MSFWPDFLRKRDAVALKMELSTCDGCDQCGTRCVAGFSITREEYETATEAFEALDPQEQDRIASQETTVPWPGAEETGATFTYCRYRDQQNHRCSIYFARPTICRIFGHTEWLPCPIGAISRYPEEVTDLWTSYRRHERHTFEEWDKISESGKENAEGALKE